MAVSTNRQIALQAAVERMEGLRPSGQLRYYPRELASSVLHVASVFENWLDGQSIEDSLAGAPARD